MRNTIDVTLTSEYGDVTIKARRTTRENVYTVSGNQAKKARRALQATLCENGGVFGENGSSPEFVTLNSTDKEVTVYVTESRC